MGGNGKMEATGILGVYRDSGNEHGSYYSIHIGVIWG